MKTTVAMCLLMVLVGCGSETCHTQSEEQPEWWAALIPSTEETTVQISPDFFPGNLSHTYVTAIRSAVDGAAKQIESMTSIRPATTTACDRLTWQQLPSNASIRLQIQCDTDAIAVPTSLSDAKEWRYALSMHPANNNSWLVPFEGNTRTLEDGSKAHQFRVDWTSVCKNIGGPICDDAGGRGTFFGSHAYGSTTIKGALRENELRGDVTSTFDITSQGDSVNGSIDGQIRKDESWARSQPWNNAVQSFSGAWRGDIGWSISEVIRHSPDGTWGLDNELACWNGARVVFWRVLSSSGVAEILSGHYSDCPLPPLTR